MKNFSWRIVLLWTLPLLVVGFFLWQGTFTAPSTNTSMSGNAANTRMTYGRFLDYLNSGRVTSVELYENGRTAIVQAIDPELDNRLQKLRVDLPANSPALIAKLRDADLDFDYHHFKNEVSKKQGCYQYISKLNQNNASLFKEYDFYSEYGRGSKIFIKERDNLIMFEGYWYD